MLRLILMMTLFVSLLSQAQNSQHTESPWKIIGDDNLMVVTVATKALPVAYRRMVKAIGRINVGCTATHIGGGYVLTAGHCFFAPSNPAKDAECDDVEIEWGLREGSAPYLVSKCEKIVLMKNDLVRDDFALLKVSPVPPQFVPMDLEKKSEVGDQVSVFSHPDDLPLRWSNFCHIQLQRYPHLPQESVKHDCDTKVGSSGATIIDAKSLKIVAIHGGGRLEDDGSGMNYGTAITSPDLLSELKNLGF